MNWPWNLRDEFVPFLAIIYILLKQKKFFSFSCDEIIGILTYLLFVMMMAEILGCRRIGRSSRTGIG